MAILSLSLAQNTFTPLSHVQFLSTALGHTSMPTCVVDTILSELKVPQVSSAASSFCSTYICITLLDRSTTTQLQRLL